MPKGGFMRRLFLVLLLAVVALGLTVAAQQQFTISGRIGATDQEVQEGYFALDAQTMLVVKPGTEAHAYLRGKVGQRVRVTIQPEPESE
jgi:hypothetical protein